MEESHQANSNCWRNSRSAQAALEYLLIVALTFIILVPAAYLFYGYSKQSSQEVKDSQITQLGRSIVDTAETIFYSGSGSKTELELNMPDNVNGVRIVGGRELVFNIRTESGDMDLVFFSKVSLTTTVCSTANGDIIGLEKAGLKTLKIEAIRDVKDCIKIETM